jgi:hypothetical protein
MQLKADRRSGGQEIPHVFMEPEDSLPCPQEPDAASYRKLHESSSHLHTHFFTLFLMFFIYAV